MTDSPASASDQNTPDEETSARPAAATSSGAGRALIAVYGLFALAATSRAAVQIATRYSEAPLAYLLSALAAVVYIVATISLARGWRRAALTAVLVELIGVLAVGTLSLLEPAAFPRATVWSLYGIGYGFVPLVLPVLGLLWLRSTRPAPAPSAPTSPPAQPQR